MSGLPVFFLTPPAEVDVGTGTALHDAPVTPSVEVLAGFQLASLAWEPTRFDLGGGYVGSFRETSLDAATRDETAAPGHLHLNGAYLSAGYAVDSRKHWRTWVTGRVETLHASLDEQHFDAWGAAARLQTELYVTGKGVQRTQGAGLAEAGTLAIGFYVETIYRELPAALGPTSVAGGLTLRIPLAFGGAS